MTSRIDTMPTRRSPSTTGMWRYPCSARLANAAVASTSGATQSGSAVIHAATVSPPGLAAPAARRTRSRSVRIPVARSPSTTTTDPTPCSRIRAAAAATVSSAVAVTTGVLMISETSIRALLPLPLCCSPSMQTHRAYSAARTPRHDGPMTDGRISASEIAEVYVPLAERLGARFLGDDPPPVPVVAVVGSVAVGQEHDRTRAPGRARGLARAAARRAGGDGRVSAPERRARRARSHHAQGVPRELRPRRAREFLAAAQRRRRRAPRAGLLPRALRRRARLRAGGGATTCAARWRASRSPSPVLRSSSISSSTSTPTSATSASGSSPASSRCSPRICSRSRIQAWDEINLVNLHEHILPARDRADVVLEKRADHVVSRVVVREPGRDTMGA